MERVVVVGAGRMGIPMAQALALAGYTVELVDLKERTDRGWAELVLHARREWAANGRLLGERTGRFWKRLRLRRGYGRWLKSAAYLFEALPEEPDLKRQVYGELGRWLKPECIVGSTTSSLTPADLAPSLAHPERFLLTHWLHPALAMPLVEVAPGEDTAPEALAQMLDLLRRCGKEPVVLAPRPGQVVARLQVMLMNEAAKMAEEGLGSPAEIDRAVRLGLGFRFLVRGLLEFADATGLDTLCKVGNQLSQALADAKFAPPEPVVRRAQEGSSFYGEERPSGADAVRAYLRLQEYLGTGQAGAGQDGEGE